MSQEKVKEQFDEAYAQFKALLKAELAGIQPDCICAYPRLIDFLFKNTTDAYLLKSLLIADCLTNTDVQYGVFYEEEIYQYRCETCGSTYQHTYQENGRNEWEILNNCAKPMGSPVAESIPNYLDFWYAALQGKESFFEQLHFYAASATEVRDYLFEKSA